MTHRQPGQPAAPVLRRWCRLDRPRMRQRALGAERRHRVHRGSTAAIRSSASGPARPGPPRDARAGAPPRAPACAAARPYRLPRPGEPRTQPPSKRSPRSQAVAGTPLPLTRYQASPPCISTSRTTTSRPPGIVPTAGACASGRARSRTLEVGSAATRAVEPGLKAAAGLAGAAPAAGAGGAGGGAGDSAWAAGAGRGPARRRPAARGPAAAPAPPRPVPGARSGPAGRRPRWSPVAGRSCSSRRTGRRWRARRCRDSR